MPQRSLNLGKNPHSYESVKGAGESGAFPATGQDTGQGQALEEFTGTAEEGESWKAREVRQLRIANKKHSDML